METRQRVCLGEGEEIIAHKHHARKREAETKATKGKKAPKQELGWSGDARILGLRNNLRIHRESNNADGFTHRLERGALYLVRGFTKNLAAKKKRKTSGIGRLRERNRSQAEKRETRSPIVFLDRE